jgi:hypothetical protein
MESESPKTHGAIFQDYGFTFSNRNTRRRKKCADFQAD